jgi:hypothetical protein
MKEVRLTTKIQITQDDFENIIVGALEGGSNYWYCLGDNLPPKDSDRTPLSTRIATKLFTDPDYKLPIHDIEDPEGEPLGYITQQSMLDAYGIVAEKWPSHFSDMIGDNHDACTADVFFQVAVMGDIVFG